MHAETAKNYSFVVVCLFWRTSEWMIIFSYMIHTESIQYFFYFDVKEQQRKHQVEFQKASPKRLSGWHWVKYFAKCEGGINTRFLIVLITLCHLKSKEVLTIIKAECTPSLCNNLELNKYNVLWHGKLKWKSNGWSASCCIREQCKKVGFELGLAQNRAQEHFVYNLWVY